MSLGAPTVIQTPGGRIEASDLARVGEHLRGGGVIVYPTETVYGLGSRIRGPGLERILNFKNRGEAKPIPILVSDLAALAGLQVDRRAARLAEAFWPGAVTLVLQDSGGRFRPGISSSDGGVAVRVSSNPVAAGIVAELGEPLTATSANAPGAAPATDLPSALDVAMQLGVGDRGPGGSAGQVWVVDGGTLHSSPPSTVVDCRGADVAVVRQGAVPESEILATAEDGVGSFSLVFVCSGNTCRSPLAAALARRGFAESVLAGHVRVHSAGTGAFPGSPASPGSLGAASRHGLDLAAHEAALLDGETVQEADLLLVMSPHHLSVAETLGGAGKSFLLDAFAAGSDDPWAGDPVMDPFGGDDEVYERTYREIDGLVERAVERIALELSTSMEASG